MIWGIKTSLKPFGEQEPFVKPFGNWTEKEFYKNHSHRKSSSPDGLSPYKGESYARMNATQMKVNKEVPNHSHSLAHTQMKGGTRK